MRKRRPPVVSVERFPVVVSKWESKTLDGSESSESADDPSGGQGEANESSGR